MKKIRTYWRLLRQFYSTFQLICWLTLAAVFTAATALMEPTAAFTRFCIALPWAIAIITSMQGIGTEMRAARDRRARLGALRSWERAHEQYREGIARAEMKASQAEFALERSGEELAGAHRRIADMEEYSRKRGKELLDLREMYLDQNTRATTLEDEKKELENDKGRLELEVRTLRQRNEQWEADRDAAVADTEKAWTERMRKKDEEMRRLRDRTRHDLDSARAEYEEQKMRRDQEFTDIMSHMFAIPESGRKWFRHYKGGSYRLIATASSADSAAHTEMVVYESMISGELYVRSASKFYSSIPVRTAKELGIPFKVGDTLPPRFEEISQEEAEEIAVNWKWERRGEPDGEDSGAETGKEAADGQA